MAAFEFQLRLRAELGAAAEREQLRGGRARAAAAARSLLPGIARSAPAVAFGLAAVVAALVVAGVVLVSGGERRPVTPPEQVDQRSFADSLGVVVAAYGSVWMSDTNRGELLRVDRHTRRVTARLPMQGEVSIAAGAGSLWVLQKGSARAGSEFGGPLLRVDPRTNHVLAEVPLRTPDGKPFTAFDVLGEGSHIWVGGPGGALRVDPRTNRVTAAVAPAGRLFTSHFVLVRRALWSMSTDGRLRAFDPSTGRKLRDIPVAVDNVSDFRGAPGGALFVTVPGGLARLDPLSGGALWRAGIGERATAGAEAGGMIWARSSGPRRDRLSALDPKTGRVLTSVPLDDFGGTFVTAIDDELWLSTGAGNVTILRR